MTQLARNLIAPRTLAVLVIFSLSTSVLIVMGFPGLTRLKNCAVASFLLKEPISPENR